MGVHKPQSLHFKEAEHEAVQKTAHIRAYASAGARNEDSGGGDDLSDFCNIRGE